MRSSDKSVQWSMGPSEKTFIGFLQLFTDRTVTTLKASGMVAHAVHITLVNLDKHTRRSFIQNGHTIVGFLPCTKIERSHGSNSCCTNDNITEQGQPFLHDGYRDIEDEVQVEEMLTQTSSAHGRLVKLGLIQVALKYIIQPLLDTNNNGFRVGVLDGVLWTCFPCLCSPLHCEYG